jgi:ankyrin repeat protein
MVSETEDVFETVHRLIKHGDRPGVRAWVSGGGDVNLRNKFGWSLLMLAALHGRTDMVEDLVAAGAEANLANDFGDTALGLARLKGFTRTAEAIERAMVRYGV